MMRVWSYRQSFNTPPVQVWVDDLQAPEIPPFGREESGFVPVETIVVGLRVRIDPVVGVSHFVDADDRLWFVSEVRRPFGRAFMEVACSRYDFRQGLGYDIPPSRSSQFGPPAGWGLVDAAGVPVQVLRVRALTAFPSSGSPITYWLSFYVGSGDTGTVPGQTVGVPASLRRRGGRAVDIRLALRETSSQSFDSFSTWLWWEVGTGAYGGTADPSSGLTNQGGVALYQSLGVAVDDFVVISPA